MVQSLLLMLQVLELLDQVEPLEFKFQLETLL